MKRIRYIPSPSIQKNDDTQAPHRLLLETSNAVVLYQQSENQILLRNKPKDFTETESIQKCKTCGHKTTSSSDTVGTNADVNVKQFIDQSYFSILEDFLSSSSFNQGYYDRFFVEIKKLGRGQRGMVFLCRHVLDTIELGEFAIKAVPTGSSHSWLVKMLREVMLLGKLKHPNVIDYKHAWLENRQLSPYVPEVPCLFILMELANGGNLEDFIQLGTESYSNSFSQAFQPQGNSRDVLNSTLNRQRSISNQPSYPVTLRKTVMENYVQETGGLGINERGLCVRYLKSAEIDSLFTDILLGLQHLHSNGIIHRDLKPPNLLLHFAEGDITGTIPRVMISDFGECQLLSDEIIRMRSGGTGTLEFMPPEMLQKNEFGEYYSNHSIAVDLWSLGVVLYFLCYSTVPYSQIEDIDLLKEEILNFDPLRLQFPVTRRVPTHYISIIKRLLSRDAHLRPGVDELILELVSVKKTQKEADPNQQSDHERRANNDNPKQNSAAQNLLLITVACSLPSLPALMSTVSRPYLSLGLAINKTAKTLSVGVVKSYPEPVAAPFPAPLPLPIPIAAPIPEPFWDSFVSKISEMSTAAAGGLGKLSSSLAETKVVNNLNQGAIDIVMPFALKNNPTLIALAARKGIRLAVDDPKRLKVLVEKVGASGMKEWLKNPAAGNIVWKEYWRGVVDEFLKRPPAHTFTPYEVKIFENFKNTFNGLSDYALDAYLTPATAFFSADPKLINIFASTSEQMAEEFLKKPEESKFLAYGVGRDIVKEFKRKPLGTIRASMNLAKGVVKVLYEWFLKKLLDFRGYITRVIKRVNSDKRGRIQAMMDEIQEQIRLLRSKWKAKFATPIPEEFDGNSPGTRSISIPDPEELTTGNMRSSGFGSSKLGLPGIAESSISESDMVSQESALWVWGTVLREYF